MLALGRGVAYAVDARGRVRSLGQATDGDLSPHGTNAVVASGSGLLAVHVADGQVRWRVPAPGPVSLPRWSVERTVPPCCRVAYLARGALYVVGGDGRGARRVAPHALAVAPAWRPRGTRHELAFAVPGAVRILSTDGRARGTRLAAPTPPRRARAGAPTDACSRCSTRPARRSTALPGKRLARIAVRGGSVLDGGFAPAGNRLVVLRRDTSGRTSLLVRGISGPLRPVRHLLLTAVGDLRFSPDGRSVLVASREGDEWIDIRLRDGRQRRCAASASACARA